MLVSKVHQPDYREITISATTRCQVSQTDLCCNKDTKLRESQYGHSFVSRFNSSVPKLCSPFPRKTQGNHIQLAKNPKCSLFFVAILLRVGTYLMNIKINNNKHLREIDVNVSISIFLFGTQTKC